MRMRPEVCTHLVVVLGSEEDGDESQPDDAGAVHGEADVLGLVEVLRDLPGLERVPRAEEDEHHVVGERDHEREAGRAARLDGDLARGVDHLHAWRLDEQPHDHAQHLNADQT